MDDGLSLRKPNGMIGVPQLCETLINTDPAVIEGLGLDLDFSWADGAQIEHSEAHRKKKVGRVIRARLKAFHKHMKQQLAS